MGCSSSPCSRPSGIISEYFMSDFSVIIWGNDDQEVDGLCLPSITPPRQTGKHTVQSIQVRPEGRARNMGEAYNGGKSLATFPIKIYVHQDLVVEDRDFLTKLSDMLEQNPRIGMVGMVGSSIDTGGAFFHAPSWCKFGESVDTRVDFDMPGTYFHDVHGIDTAWATRFRPEKRRVAVLDCLLFASPLSLPFATCYHKTHMVAEDYCMRVRQAGYEVWTIDAKVKHFSSGKVDQTYWDSVRTFRRRWKRALPPQLPPLSVYKQAYDTPGSGGGWDDIWNERPIPQEVTV